MHSVIGEFATFHFCSDQLPADHRLTFLRDTIGRSFLDVEIAAISERPLYVEGSLRILPDLAMLSAYTHGLRLERGPQLIADGNDSFCLVVVSAGRAQIKCADQDIT